MATINGSKGFFQITSIHINGGEADFPQAVAWGETARVSVTLKNVSGKAVSRMYVIPAFGFDILWNLRSGRYLSLWRKGIRHEAGQLGQ